MKYNNILSNPRISTEDKEYFKLMYDKELPNKRFSAKGNICKENFMKVCEILYNEKI